MRRSSICWLAALALIFDLPDAGFSADIDEFKVKRQEVFEFTEKPKVARDVTTQPDRFVITFASKAFCDATVAIEDANGRIVRHLASGVLGPNAPEPFQKKSLVQTLVWDSKDDQGKYVDDKNSTVARVSLGLKPQFERSLFWSPQKGVGQSSVPLFRATPDGVYVHDGCGVDQVRLFDHGGDYVRTIYPFPSAKLKDVQGLDWGTFPQDDAKLPLRLGSVVRGTLLPSGTSGNADKSCRGGRAGSALAVWKDRIALPYHLLGRLATNGTSGGLSIKGPAVTLTGRLGDYYNGTGRKDWPVEPRSVAFSPDGKWLYMTGYTWASCTALGGANWAWFHVVMRVAYAEDAAPTAFAGVAVEGRDGTDDTHFRCPASVATDSQGRVYVADYMNNRIQVFSPDGEHLKTLPVTRPAHIEVAPKSGEIYSFSWMLASRFLGEQAVPAKLTRLGGFDNPKVVAEYALPFKDYKSTAGWTKTGGFEYRAAVDFWAETPTIWLSPGPGVPIKLVVDRDGKLETKRDFAAEIAQTVVRDLPPVLQRQRLYVHPRTGLLYVAEGDSGVNKSFKQLVEINPANGKVRLMDIPITAEEMCIDINGLFYFKTDCEVMRFEPGTWREVPFDYGEDRKMVGFDPMVASRSATSALILPVRGRPSCWHMGGMDITAKGHLVVNCNNPNEAADRRAEVKKFNETAGRRYDPPSYPGRVRYAEVHIFDERGKVLVEDVVPGLTVADGIGIDKDDNVYVMANPNRMLDGKPYFIGTGETLMRILPRGAKVISSSNRAPVPAAGNVIPKRPPDLAGHDIGSAWVEGAQWFYGGVGFGVKGDCVCYNARFALDLFARSFAPELDHSSVAVLDSNGNLILRVGQYGNVDEGKPLVPAGGPANPRSIGGDEVALFYAPYVGTHTDRRLFIADPGNQRIASVKLDYHATEKVPLGIGAEKGR